MNKIILTAVLFILFAAYGNAQVEYLNSEMDGSVTLRATGQGKNQKDAVEQAKKNALYEVIFNGIRGAEGSLQRPLIFEVNAREKHSNYFNQFFSDKGPYRDFISMKDQKKGSKVKIDGDVQVKYIITVRVLVPELKNQLTQDKIIKKK